MILHRLRLTNFRGFESLELPFERDLTVLTLHRGSTVIPNPKRSTVLEAGDRLLCFGKLEEMRALLPKRKRRRSRKLRKQDLPGATIQPPPDPES